MLSSRSLDNLVSVYVTLFRNLLVPSTALELHFLLRLIALKTNTLGQSPEQEDDSSPFLQPLFDSSKACQAFASRALVALWPTLRNISPILLVQLTECQPLRVHASEFVKLLETQLDKWRYQGLTIENSTEAVTGTHALLNLPFDQERDSRHNYRSQSEVAAYKNREESRDAFLYELRAFMSTKGTVLRTQEIERAQERVKRESRTIMDNLMRENMAWFAEFFCELLAQVGLAPVQETDKEILSIANKEKLQVSTPFHRLLPLNFLLIQRAISIHRNSTSDSRLGVLILRRVASSFLFKTLRSPKHSRRWKRLGISSLVTRSSFSYFLTAIRIRSVFIFVITWFKSSTLSEQHRQIVTWSA